MAKTKLIYFELTEKQIEAIAPIIEQVENASARGKYGMALAQFHVMNSGRHIVSCGFISHDKALKIQSVMSPKSVGETTERINYDKVFEQLKA